MRKPFIAGNWKMHKTVVEAVDLAVALKAALADVSTMDLAVCPTATALEAVSHVLTNTNIGVGAQNMYWEDSGAFTGEISPLMVKELATYVILGHSERRQYFGETDATVNLKLKAAIRHGLTPIVCIGESLAQNEAGETVPFVGNQIRGAFAGISQQDAGKVVLAYEPVWAIGTGKTASSEQAQEVHALIRQVLTGLYDATVAQAVRIQYGGSVKPANARELFAMPDIDGGLIGGAALDAKSFIDIVRAAV